MRIIICGLRRAEAVSLKVSDVIDDHQALGVLGKANKQRKVFPDAGTLAALADWQDNCPPIDLAVKPPIIPHRLR